MFNFIVAQIRNCPANSTDLTCNVNLPQVAADNNAVATIVQLVFGVVGSLAVLFIVYGGFKFVAAQGDPQGIKKARETIIYALIGLGIALTAEAIVAFVIKQV